MDILYCCDSRQATGWRGSTIQLDKIAAHNNDVTKNAICRLGEALLKVETIRQDYR